MTYPVRIDPGSVIGPYTVERRLAQGGMSVLFLVKDDAGREAVIKLVPDELATSASRARLMREARALASLDHPGIVRIFGFGDHEGAPWIAMEYVRGVDLKRIVADRGAVTPEQAMRWVVQAADALVAAHDAGVIHRDLKPSNLLLTHDDAIKIVDFGIAKRRTDAGAGDVLTSQREVLGTPAYLSPEQLEHGLADERSDVWALGCVLYELVVGAPPFGRGGSATTMAAILRDEPVFPNYLTGAIVHVINGCLRKNSFARIGSPRELALLLRDALENPSSELAAPPDRASTLSSRAPAFRPSDRPPARASNRPSRSAERAEGSTQRVPIAPQAPSARSSSSMRAARRSIPPAQPGRIKGTAVRAGLTWYAETYGPESLQQAYDQASPELRAMLRMGDPAFGVIASGWYDIACVGELLELLERLAGAEDADQYVNEITHAIAKDNVGGIYRSLFKLISSPSMLEANAQRVWSTYVDEGAFFAKIPEPGKLMAEVRAWTHHHPTVCRTVGFMIQNVLREIGYTALVIERAECVGMGDARCAFEGLYLP
jgi:serine/threonine-protein kinase